jgi:hypothetical protein
MTPSRPRPYYDVNGKVFYNPFSAFFWAAHNDTHTFPKFNFFDNQFCDINWHQEPQQSWQDLKESRARSLREKYDKLILAFSGGTDSTTVYRVFEKLKIHIDEIVIGYNERNAVGQPKQNVHWILKNHWDKTTKITHYNREKQWLNDSNFLNDESLILPDSSGVPYIHAALSGPQDRFFSEYLRDQYQDSNWCLLFGYEKPHVLKDQAGWWVTHLSKVYQFNTRPDHVEWFFIDPQDPTLHIKQCHLLKNYASKFINPITNWSSVTHGVESSLNYDQICVGAGRDIEISPGISFQAKNFHTKVLDFDLAKISNFEDLKTELIGVGDRHYLTNFLKPWKSLSVDKTTIDYMVRMQLLKPHDSIQNYHGIWSKKYFLGT